MTCRHRWLIDTPAPGISLLGGVCRECGAQREFRAFDRGDYLGESANWLVKEKRRRTQPRLARGGDR